MDDKVSPPDKTEVKQPEQKKTGLLGGKIFSKLKTVKHIEIIILIIFAAVLLLVIFGFSGKKSDAPTGGTSLEEYQKRLERQLANTLSKIEGAGAIDVMITFETGSEQVIAYSTDKTTNSSTEGGRTTSSTTERSQIVLIGGKPVVLYEVQPKIKGVIIVAEGAEIIKVKVEITKAVSTILDVDTMYIEIFAMSKV